MKIKNIILASLAVIMLFTTSCEDDVLVKSNPNKPGMDEFYKTPEDAEQAVTAAYSALQFFGVYNRYWSYAMSARSDESDFTEFQVGLPEVQGLDNFTMTADLLTVKEMWQDNYRGILKANMVLKNVPDISFSDENQKNRILGEAYFLRALYHFNLVRNFGEIIPLYSKVPESTEDFFPHPAKEGEVYTQIIADFEMAKSLLPIVDTYRGTFNLGKASKGAAVAFLGKAYLFTEQYQLAAEQFAEIINGEAGTYVLTQSFRDNHDNSNENNMESLFEVQYKLTPGKDVWNITYENDNASEAQIIEQGQTMVRDVGGMWWNMLPSEKMANEFETSDPRFYKTFWCAGGDTYLWNDLDMTYEQYVPAKYEGSVFWRKWCRDYATGNWESDVNVRVMRLADVYLMYAECLINGATGSGSPEQYINLVRDRARNIPGAENYPLSGSLPSVEDLISSAPTINGITIDNIEAALRHERMVELAFEGKRWEDIVRWGIGKEACGEFFKPLLPIYQGDLDTNPNLVPNSSN